MRTSLTSFLFIFLYLGFISFAFITKSQVVSSSKSIFWEISGKDLKSPSYLYGTFHLLNGNYLNKIEKWKSKFKDSRAVVVEMVMDSSKLMQLVGKMVSTDTTLDELLTASEYERVNVYFKEVSGMDLQPYNSLKPISLSVLLTSYTWAKLKPEDYISNDLPMDLYFVKKGKDDVKEIIALESMEEQVSLLYDGMSLKRQKEILMEMVNNKEKTQASLLKMDDCYRQEDLECLKELIYSNNSYKQDELDKLLHDRNIAWMSKILSAINTKSTFIAVGAGHLTGEEGLINLLRKEGYTLEPIVFN